MNTILVPVDFSKHSEYALEVAALIAKKLQARIVLTHMLGIADSYLTKDEQKEVFNLMYLMKITRERFQALKQQECLKDIEVIEAVQVHKVFTEINEVAAHYKTDLIVMGSHGTTGIKELFIGSNTEKVVRTANVPVLVIKDRILDFNITKAVFVTDFEDNNLKSYKTVCEFFNYFQVVPRLLFINVPERFMSTGEIERMAFKFMASAGIDPKDFKERVAWYSDYSVERGIYHYCKEAKIDSIAISTHGRRGLGHFFYGSIGEDLANHAQIPVLTCKL